MQYTHFINQQTGIIAMSEPRCLSYDSSHRPGPGRYVHKYYLPDHLKEKVFPVDIEAIVHSSDNGGITINYKDLSLEKQLDAETCDQVRAAWDRYMLEYRATLLPAETAACHAFNQRLAQVAQQALDEIRCQESKISQRIMDGDGYVQDYELTIRVEFYLRDDDPLCRASEANWTDLDGDIELVTRLTLHKEMLEPDEVPHSDGSCFLFRQLVEQAGIPRKHLSRIGAIDTDIIVQLQHFSGRC
jgi:hypothetical protein